MNKEEYTEIDNYNLSEMLFNRDERLIEMIKGLREERDYIFNKLTCEKGYLQEKLNKKEDRIERLNNIINKAIEYIERNCLEFNVKYACQGLNNDKVDVLLDILRGEEDESN